ncbi:MAG: hypothetical protein M3022_05740 [Actinomycetota bacterium]|nr:hypothetical protein [Actinomycetota bacterium]
MDDDWRLRITLTDPRDAGRLTEELRDHTRQEDLRRTMHDRVIVSTDESEVFCYAGSREQAEVTATTVTRLADEHGWNVSFELRHWHPTAEQWEEADVPLPADDAARAGERAERIAHERAESAQQGYPEFEVRVQCASRGEAGELAVRLRNEGIPVVQRFRAVLVGATDEDSAEQFAVRLRGEAPRGAQVTVEGNLRAVYEDGPWRPFSILGGMGG